MVQQHCVLWSDYLLIFPSLAASSSQNLTAKVTPHNRPKNSSGGEGAVAGRSDIPTRKTKHFAGAPAAAAPSGLLCHAASSGSQDSCKSEYSDSPACRAKTPPMVSQEAMSTIVISVLYLLISAYLLYYRSQDRYTEGFTKMQVWNQYRTIK